MALRLSGTDPFLRASIGAFNGYACRNSVISGATLLKRGATTAWHGIHVIDNGSTTNYDYLYEFDPNDRMASDFTTASPFQNASNNVFLDSTNWIILGFCWDGTTTANHVTYRWKIGSGAWQNETRTSGGANATAAGSGYRHLIGNEAGLGDDANFDWVCTGLIKSNLSQATFESLTMTDIASWDAVFTGAGAWLLDGQATATRTDRTGNGGNEVSRSGSITLQSDPPGWSWGGTASIPDVVMAPMIGY